MKQPYKCSVPPAQGESPGPSRREVLRSGAAAAALAALGAHLEAAGSRRLQEIGIIGGVPKEMAGDYQKSLSHLARVGYKLLESGSRGPSPQEFLRFLDGIGMRLVCSGVTVNNKLAPNWLDTALALKVPYVVSYWPWFYPLEQLTMAQLQEIAEVFNRCGKQARAAGVKLAVHNHDRDFRLLDGKPVFDRLVEMTDPEYVTVQLDLYWAIRAGVDPVEYFKRYLKRFEMFHIKDMGPEPEREITVVGRGSIDWARIFAHSETAGVKYYIVEQQEGRTNTMQAAEDSFRYLSQLRF